METIDSLAVLASLGVNDAGAVEPVDGGWDTAIWRVERGGEIFALRLFRTEQGRAARYEVAALWAASAAGVAVPRVHAEGLWEGRPAMLLSWCAGRTVAAELASRPWRAGRLGTALGREHARVHAVPPPDLLREQPDGWLDWAGRVEGPLRERLRAAAGPPSLLHYDFHPFNLLTDGRGVTAVLDWVNARAGDRRADLARTVAILRLVPPDPGTPPHLAILRRVVLRALERGWRQGYRAAVGSIGDMAPFYAWAGGVLLRDLGSKIGRPGIWLRSEHLEPARRWTAHWTTRAGLP